MTLPESPARYLGLCSSFGHINGVQSTMTYLISRSRHAGERLHLSARTYR